MKIKQDRLSWVTPEEVSPPMHIEILVASTEGYFSLATRNSIGSLSVYGGNELMAIEDVKSWTYFPKPY